MNRFLQVADYYLVAHALAYGYTLVTHEIPANSKKKIKIPNACIGVRFKFMTPYEMLGTSARDLSWAPDRGLIGALGFFRFLRCWREI